MCWFRSKIRVGWYAPRMVEPQPARKVRRRPVDVVEKEAVRKGVLDRDVYDAVEAAAVLGLSIDKLQDEIKARRLRVINLGGRGGQLLRREWLIAWMELVAEGGA